MVYPIEMKEAVLKKVLMSGKPYHEIAREPSTGFVDQILLEKIDGSAEI